MTIYDRKFAKPDENGRPLYCPLPLAIVIHHHDEGINPETGEHWENDWDERRTEVFPSAEDKALMGYLPLSPDAPIDPPEGKHYERTDKVERYGDGYKWVYVLVPDPPPPPRRWTRLSIKTALAQAGMLDDAKAFLSSIEVATGYTAWEALTDCDYIEEGYGGAEAWDAILDGAATALGKTRDEIDSFLDSIPTEGGM
jgi:hypothetical protein